MSSGTKRCALGVHCFVFKLHIYDRSRVDWTGIQDFDEKSKATTLLLKAEGAAGNTVHLAEDVRMGLDYLDALGGGRYRCVVVLVLVLDVFSYSPYIHVSFFCSLFALDPEGHLEQPSKYSAAADASAVVLLLVFFL
jgi:hypothetical protein